MDPAGITAFLADWGVLGFFVLVFAGGHKGVWRWNRELTAIIEARERELAAVVEARQRELDAIVAALQRELQVSNADRDWWKAITTHALNIGEAAVGRDSGPR